MEALLGPEGAGSTRDLLARLQDEPDEYELSIAEFRQMVRKAFGLDERTRSASGFASKPADADSERGRTRRRQTPLAVWSADAPASPS